MGVKVQGSLLSNQLLRGLGVSGGSGSRCAVEAWGGVDLLDWGGSPGQELGVRSLGMGFRVLALLLEVSIVALLLLQQKSRL